MSRLLAAATNEGIEDPEELASQKGAVLTLARFLTRILLEPDPERARAVVGRAIERVLITRERRRPGQVICSKVVQAGAEVRRRGPSESLTPWGVGGGVAAHTHGGGMRRIQSAMRADCGEELCPRGRLREKAEARWSSE